LETRLLALLDTTTPRGRIRGRVAAALAGFTFLAALPVAAFTLSPSSVVQQHTDREPDTVSDSVTNPLSERLQPAIVSTPVPGALAGPDSLLARRLWEAARTQPRHAIDLVPERAAWALTRERNGRLIDPLIESLGSRNWRLTAYAAWALGISRDPRAVPALLPYMDHAVWRVRAMTAFALQEIADPRAREVMDRALADPAWQVRSQAVRYLATSGAPGVVERLKSLLSDRHIAVRLAAEQALAIH
jgi:HEAT repeat protein